MDFYPDYNNQYGSNGNESYDYGKVKSVSQQLFQPIQQGMMPMPIVPVPLMTMRPNAELDYNRWLTSNYHQQQAFRSTFFDQHQQNSHSQELDIGMNGHEVGTLIEDNGVPSNQNSVANSPRYGPGPPIVTSDRVKGPRGCNLFVFHLPNEITNWDLYLLFRKYGTILSVHTMINKATGLSKGYGFVSYSAKEEAKSAISAMDGFRLGKKRLKVQVKRSQSDAHGPDDDAGLFIMDKEEEEEEEEEEGEDDNEEEDIGEEQDAEEEQPARGGRLDEGGDMLFDAHYRHTHSGVGGGVGAVNNAARETAATTSGRRGYSGKGNVESSMHAHTNTHTYSSSGDTSANTTRASTPYTVCTGQQQLYSRSSSYGSIDSGSNNNNIMHGTHTKQPYHTIAPCSTAKATATATATTTTTAAAAAPTSPTVPTAAVVNSSAAAAAAAAATTDACRLHYPGTPCSPPAATAAATAARDTGDTGDTGSCSSTSLSTGSAITAPVSPTTTSTLNSTPDRMPTQQQLQHLQQHQLASSPAVASPAVAVAAAVLPAGGEEGRSLLEERLRTTPVPLLKLAPRSTRSRAGTTTDSTATDSTTTGSTATGAEAAGGITQSQRQQDSSPMMRAANRQQQQGQRDRGQSSGSGSGSSSGSSSASTGTGRGHGPRKKNHHHHNNNHNGGH